MATSAVARRSGSGRVTPAKVKPSTSTEVDVDAILAEKGIAPRDVEDIPTFGMTVFGEHFRVLRAVNILGLIMADDDDPQSTATSVRTIINLVHPDDRKRFQNAYAALPELSGEALNEIIAAMLSGAANPNRSASRRGSGRTAKRTTSRALSAAN
jgi:hypothetical protein